MEEKYLCNSCRHWKQSYSILDCGAHLYGAGGMKECDIYLDRNCTDEKLCFKSDWKASLSLKADMREEGITGLNGFGIRL